MVAWLRAHPRLLVLGIAILMAGLSVLALLSLHSGVLRVAFLDVGQGDAVLITAPNGTTVLYDTGAPGRVRSPLASVLPFWDRSLDLVILSHPDLDHVGGVPEVFRSYEVARVMDPGLHADTGGWARAREAFAREGATRIEVREGYRVDLGSGVVLDILSPSSVREQMDANAASVTVLLRYGKTAFLLPGDLPSSGERALAARYGTVLRSDVLKLGHHGSKTSSDPVFLAASRPSFAVVSVGEGNRYGHPHREVMERLSPSTTPVLTSRDGTIVFSSDGRSVSRER